MIPNRYKVVFRGEIKEDFQPDEVKTNLMQIFKLASAQIEMLLKNASTTIKQDIDHETALKYKFAMLEAGAVCHIETMHPVQKPSFSEKRNGARRGIMNRRKQPRLSSIQPDRRNRRGRRSTDK